MIVVSLMVLVTQAIGQRPTGNQLLETLLENTNSTPLNLYPPEYFDWLANLGTNQLPGVSTNLRPVRSGPVGPLIVNEFSDGHFGMMAMSRAAPSDSAPEYDYIIVDLGTLGGSGSSAAAINNGSQVVGSAKNSSQISRPALFTSPVTDLGTLGGSDGLALGISSDGKITGAAAEANDLNHAFMWNGSIHDLGTLGGQQSAGYAINSSGQVTGIGQISGDVNHAMLYSGTSMTDLGTFPTWSGPYGSTGYGINDYGDIGGAMVTNAFARGFLRVDGTMQDIGTLGGNEASVYGINSYAEVVGYSTTSSGGHHAMFYDYQNDDMQDLGVLSGATSSDAYAINNAAHVVGASGGHAFLVSNGSMKDLNNLVINNGSGWTLQYASGINDKDQIVGYGTNPSGQTHAFLLSPIDSNDLPTIQVGKTHPAYGNGIIQQSGKTKLVVITHGRIRPGEDPAASIAWVDTMFTSISNYLSSHGMTDWQVATYKWVAGAQGKSDIDVRDFQTILGNAEMEGKKLGNSIVTSGNWAHVHLIGHSAGAGLIQTCSEVIRANFQDSCSIHCTFLDPFTGDVPNNSVFNHLGLNNVPVYGNQADWSDDYFTRDQGTGGDVWPATEGHLDHAHSVDVTYLDPNKIPLKGYDSTSTGAPCQKTETTHGWPIDFYMNTISGNLSGVYGAQYYLNFGFPLGLEANNWNNLQAFYSLGNNPADNLGPQDPDCVQLIQNSTGTATSGSMDFNSGTQLPFGVVQPAGWGLNMSADDPAWLAKFITLTNPANYIAFDAQFTANPLGAGELSVYWDTNVIGFVDEALVGSGLHHYVFSFPSAFANSSHMLGLRIDAASDGSVSSISITNVIMAYVGVSQPFTLSVTTNIYNGLQVFQLSGQPGFNYKVQASTNLLNWSDIAVLVNSNGIVPFTDPDSTNYSQRFYRAVAPY